MAEQNFGDVGEDVNIDHAGGDITKAGQDVVGRDKIQINVLNGMSNKEKSFIQATKAAFINRTDQWNKCIKKRMRNEHDKKTFAFVAFGVWEEWPASFIYRFRHEHKLISKDHLPIKLDVAANTVEELLISFQEDLLLQLECSKTDIDRLEPSQLKNLLLDKLSNAPAPLFFYSTLKKEIAEKHNYIQATVEFWESLDVATSTNQHILLIIYDTPKKGWFNFGARAVEKRRSHLEAKLGKNIVLSKLKSIEGEEIRDWIRDTLQDEEQTKVGEALEKMKNNIPHLTLKDTYIKIISPKT